MPSMKRQAKSISKRALRKILEATQPLGFDLLPRHFYSEIPNLKDLKGDKSWRAPFSMKGVSGTDPEGQLEFIAACCPPPIVDELRTRDIHALASSMNGESGFGPVEADLLFAFVATKRPEQIFQVGCGVSTAVCLLAADHAGYSPEILCVEPYPNEFLKQSAEKRSISLIDKKIQTIDLSIIDDLGGDLLFFVDSSHTLGPSGEVSRIILEMLPRLKKGAFVHFHDIKFPYDYDRHILHSTLFFHHESVLLHAFLTHNNRFSISASMSMLHYANPDAVREHLPTYRPAGNVDGLNASDGHFPSSTYLEVVG